MKKFLFIFFVLTSLVKADQYKLKWGNDFLAPDGLDRYLSNYFTLSHTSNKSTWSFDNSMFTPDNLRGSPVESKDHPWDGASILSHEERFDISGNERRRFKLSAGAVGRASGAAELQRWVHAQGFGARPSYQPTNPSEPVLNFGYRHDDITQLNTLIGIAQNTTTYGFDVGNYITQAVLTQRLKKGFNGAYGLLGIEGRAVLYSTVLDGRLFQDNEYTVQREPFVAEFMIGVGAEIDSYIVELVYKYETEQFETQDDRHLVAELTISYKY